MKDRYIDGHAQRRIDQVRVGDLLELEHDEYADPAYHHDGYGSDNFKYEFARVLNVERKSDNWFVLYTTQGAFRFPPDHWVNVGGD